MLDQHPVLRERLIAVSTFALILFGGAVSLDFLLTNGMQWGSDPKSSPSLHRAIQAAPSADNFVTYNGRATREPGRSSALRASPSFENLRGEIDVPYVTAAPGIEVDQLDADPKEQAAAPDADDESKDSEWSYGIPSTW